MKKSQWNEWEHWEKDWREGDEIRLALLHEDAFEYERERYAMELAFIAADLEDCKRGAAIRDAKESAVWQQAGRDTAELLRGMRLSRWGARQRWAHEEQ